MAPQNPLPVYGNEKTMNLNSLILTNIQSSPYFKVNLYELKTYHEVIDEIYYKVGHLEPWEKGSRKTHGQTGMCGGVRGVGAGGIVSSAYCLLYKLFTLKLTKKQVIGLITHQDSPYIRGLGFMYIRYTQPPPDLWDWYEEYLDDEEEIDVKAGGGHKITIGEMVRQFMLKLEWYSTLFPRIPVPVQKTIYPKLKEYSEARMTEQQEEVPGANDFQRGDNHDDFQALPRPDVIPDEEPTFGEAARHSTTAGVRSRTPVHQRGRPSPPFDIAKAISKERDRQSGDKSKHRPKRSRSRERIRDRRRSRSRERRRSRDRGDKRSRSRDRHRRERSRSHDKHSSRSHVRHKRSRSRDRHSHKYHKSDTKDRRETSFERDLRREKERQRRQKD